MALLLFDAAVLVPPAQVLVARVYGGWTTGTMAQARWRNGRWSDREWRSLDELGLVPRVVLAAEDHGFWRHSGFEWQAMWAAYQWNQAHPDAFPRGASTITQQTARNLFLFQGGGPPRKLAEAVYTVWMELLLPKSRILELYCNVAETGPTQFGFEAGAQHWFGKSASELTMEEASVLAALLPAPHRLTPDDLKVRKRAAFIRHNPAEIGELAP